MVARFVRDEEAAGSNPVSPTGRRGPWPATTFARRGPFPYEGSWDPADAGALADTHDLPFGSGQPDWGPRGGRLPPWLRRIPTPAHRWSCRRCSAAGSAGQGSTAEATTDTAADTRTDAAPETAPEERTETVDVPPAETTEPPAASAPEAPAEEQAPDHTAVIPVVEEPVTEEPAAEETAVREPVAPTPAVTPPPVPAATGATGSGRRRARVASRQAPDIGASAAAFLVGALVGLVGCALTFLGLQGCEVVAGTSSCGGPGLLVLGLIVVVMVLVGAVALRWLRVPDAGSLSFLGVGMMTVVALLFLIDHLFDPWMFLVIPCVTAVTFGIAQWITTRYADDIVDDDDDNKMPHHDIR